MKFNSILLVAILFAVTNYSCKEKGGRHITQGEIHYNINYKGYFGSLPKELLPKDLVVSFKDNKVLTEMISSFGNSGIFNLINPEKGIADTYFSLFSLRYFYAAQTGEDFPGFEAMNGIIIKKTDKTSVICGYNCKSADVTFPSDRNKIYEIWYTDEIDVKKPNSGTPFSQIEGVLMSFFFILGPVEAHFNAENVYKKDIPDKLFERRDKFVRVSRDDINKFINKMMSL